MDELEPPVLHAIDQIRTPKSVGGTRRMAALRDANLPEQTEGVVGRARLASILKRPRFSWTRIRGEYDIQGGVDE